MITLNPQKFKYEIWSDSKRESNESLLGLEYNHSKTKGDCYELSPSKQLSSMFNKQDALKTINVKQSRNSRNSNRKIINCNNTNKDGLLNLKVDKENNPHQNPSICSINTNNSYVVFDKQYSKSNYNNHSSISSSKDWSTISTARDIDMNKSTLQTHTDSEGIRDRDRDRDKQQHNSSSSNSVISPSVHSFNYSTHSQATSLTSPQSKMVNSLSKLTFSNDRDVGQAVGGMRDSQ